MLGLILFAILVTLFDYMYLWGSEDIDTRIQKDGDWVELKMPSMRDFPYGVKISQDDADKYVEKVIIPSHDYFKLQEEIKKISLFNSGAVIAAWSTLYIAIAVRLIKFLGNYNYFGLPDILSIFLALFASGLFLYIVTFINSKIYNKRKTWAKLFETMSCDYEILKRCFCPSDLNISDEQKLNNYILLKHYDELKYENVKSHVSERGKFMVASAIINFICILLIAVFW